MVAPPALEFKSTPSSGSGSASPRSMTSLARRTTKARCQRLLNFNRADAERHKRRPVTNKCTKSNNSLVLSLTVLGNIICNDPIQSADNMITMTAACATLGLPSSPGARNAHIAQNFVEIKVQPPHTKMPARAPMGSRLLCGTYNATWTETNNNGSPTQTSRTTIQCTTAHTVSPYAIVAMWNCDRPDRITSATRAGKPLHCTTSNQPIEEQIATTSTGFKIHTANNKPRHCQAEQVAGSISRTMMAPMSEARPTASKPTPNAAAKPPNSVRNRSSTGAKTVLAQRTAKSSVCHNKRGQGGHMAPVLRAHPGKKCNAKLMLICSP
mmetsp:Transcript_42306/g.122816  ORF Transcript_42306/g.122816 Transcript_42306/m.122816 type:complete len:325 (-) Transcript_42306:36-1010(-)